MAWAQRAAAVAVALGDLACAEPRAPAATSDAVELAIKRRPGAERLRDPRADEVVSVEVEAALSRIARRRGLTTSRRVPVTSLNRAELGVKLERYIRSTVPSVVIAGQEAFLKAVGVVPSDYDHFVTTLALLQRQLAGFYDPTDQQVLLAADLPPNQRAGVLVHELVHALQDEHYQLGQGLSYRPGAADRVAALHALAEGDAVSSLLDLGESERRAAQGLTSRDMLQPDVPPVVQRSAMAPYYEGLRFVTALRQRGGWEAVHQAWRRPPSTTEQLLHPDKYDAREIGRSAVPPPVPTGCVGWYSDTLGELTLRILLEEWSSPGEAVTAAGGWDGDWLSLWHCPMGVRVHWTVHFDTAADAAEAMALFLRGLTTCGRGASIELRSEGTSISLEIGPEDGCRQSPGG